MSSALFILFPAQLIYTKFYMANFSHKCPTAQLNEGFPQEKDRVAVMDHSAVYSVSTQSWEHQQLTHPQCKMNQRGGWSAYNWESHPDWRGMWDGRGAGQRKGQAITRPKLSGASGRREASYAWAWASSAKGNANRWDWSQWDWREVGPPAELDFWHLDNKAKVKAAKWVILQRSWLKKNRANYLKSELLETSRDEGTEGKVSMLSIGQLTHYGSHDMYPYTRCQGALHTVCCYEFHQCLTHL